VHPEAHNGSTRNSLPKFAVTGAFGYSGKYIAQRLIERGDEVLTLTNSPGRPNPFGDRLSVAKFNFDRPAELERSLCGVDALINTYWVRFDHKLFTHAQAVANTKILFEAARRAGVARVVHVSITNPDRNSPLPYFSGKAELEDALIASGLSYCILRPTVLFGKEDVLINNIAWGLRRMPFYGVFGDGQYRLQPIHVGDLADAAVEQAASRDSAIIDAIGPETWNYREMVSMIARGLGVRRPIVGMPPAIAYQFCRLLGWWMDDVVITWPEIIGLMEGRLCTESPPLGRTKLSDWVRRHASTLGRAYTSELARRTDRMSEYRSN
jgi:uncharacterized protein YbjT (DUF2867 family)